MKTTWNEKRIREEIARLDGKTGLNGISLPIIFSNAKCTLGQYISVNGGSFKFSNYYFQDPDWPIEEAFDVIRHEYAYYMDHTIYGNLGHGSTWQKCCGVVGALPIRCYNESRAQYYRNKHKAEAKLSARFDTCYAGNIILHPRYGTGVIEEITGESVKRYVTVDFKSVGKKKLGLAWVDKNYRRRS